jgi:hypothetical protein
MAPTQEQLNEKFIDQVIQQAARLSRDKELDTWKQVFEPAKAVIAGLKLPLDDYQAAIARLTEAMRV